MKTKIYNVTDENILKCSEDIKAGKLVVFPTETVYGIGANVYDSQACENIYKAKNRPNDNPLIVHISSINMLKEITSNISDIENKLIDIFFPGPFTLILNKSDRIPNIVTGSLNTVAVRMPNNKVANKLIEYSGVPIAAPSANISTKPSGTNFDNIINELDGRVDAVINGEQCKIGIESTVAKVIDDTVVILRPGHITKDDILSHGFKCKYDEKIMEFNKGEVLSPGMKYKHYSPNTNCVLLNCEDKDLNKGIDKVLSTYNKDIENTCILTYDEFISNVNIKSFSLGSYTNYDEISKNLYLKLREIDKFNFDLCIIHGLKETDKTIAILNRIIKTCEYNVITI